MLSKLRDVVAGRHTRQEAEKKVQVKPAAQSTFGGRSKAQIDLELQGKIKTTDFLVSSNVAESAQEAFNKSQELANKNFNPRIGTSSSSLAEEIATVFSEGDTTTAIKLITDHLNKNKGDVEKNFWYMLMDAYQVVDNRQGFEKVALAFSHKFESSAPSWFSNNLNNKPATVVAGKNILILEPTFKATQTAKFREFLKASREEKFCRINVSQCRFDTSEPEALQALYKLFKDLRKHEVKAVLMGDNNLLTFCKTYMSPNLDNKLLKREYIEIEDLCWLLYMEVLQWKGRQEEFESLAAEYTHKFEISPPGWEDSGVMRIEAHHASVEDKNDNDNEGLSSSSFYTLDKVINSTNIDALIETIERKMIAMEKVELDFSCVERIDFTSAGAIGFSIQKIWNQQTTVKKKPIIRHPNEMVATLLEMVGATEFIEIIARKR